MTDTAVQRDAVIAEALSWEGTPFHHGAQIKGVGVDCAHLLIAVYGGLSLVSVPPVTYAADWFRNGKDDLLRTWIATFGVEVARPQRGDVALYRYGRFASHAGILVATEPLELVHSFRGRGVLREEAGDTSPLFERLDSYWTLKDWAA